MSKFDKIAKPASETTKTASKVTASVTEEIKTAVDAVIAKKAEIKRLEAELNGNETTVIDHVLPQYDNQARSGSFTKSLVVPGNVGTLTAVWSDAFSIPQEPEVQAEIKKLVGPKKFEEFFDTKQTISIKADVLDNEMRLNQIADACTKAGLDIGSIFDVTDKLVAKNDLDRHQFDLDAAKLVTFRALVRQKKPSLK